jgi:hypothetical protein
MGLPLLMVSADEIVWALLRAGFVVREPAAGAELRLEKGLRRVTVASVPALTPEALRGILSDAAISYSELLELLGEAPTAPISSSQLRFLLDHPSGRRLVDSIE